MGKILVIDDEITIQTFCRDLFMPQNQVVTAGDGKSGLELVEKEQPDLVLLDLNLPHESGLSILPKIKSKYPKVPVIIFSGFLDPDIEKKVFGAGATDVVAKGGSPTELLNKVEKIFKNLKVPARRPEKILLVDDEATIRSFLATFLKEKGFVILEAASGEQAIEIVKREKPNLMLLDMNMPGMSGLETLKRVREFDKEIGVVMATASQDEDIARECAELGSYQYVLKPFDLKYLELVVLTRLLMA